MRILVFLFLSTLFISAKLHCVASIPPVKSFVEAIGDGEAELSVMVQPGNSPHSYEPKPSQMKALEGADCYFAVGVEFEKAWLPRFAAQNPQMEIVDLSRDINKLPMAHHATHEEHEAQGEHKEDHHNEGLDPHIWTSPANVKLMGRKIYETLVRLDPGHKKLFEQRFAAFRKKIGSTDAEIRSILSKLPPHSAFMVFHPSWGYFARDYGLRQLPVEVEGKAPKPRQLMHLIDEARREKVRAIFVQPEFSDKSARLLARELGIPVVQISPLAENWNANLLKLARAVAGASN